MDRKKYKKSLYIIIFLYVFISLAVPIVIYIFTGSITTVIIYIPGIALLCTLSYILHKVDDLYISSVIIQLSELIDILSQISNKEIFPDNEDTVLSKLQAKVIKLSRMLKNKEKLEEQEHENIKKLVSDIAHQLKTPIANLKMYSSFLSDETLTEEKRMEYIEVLCMSVERLDFLSENIIKVSRLESGIINLDIQRQSLNSTVLKAVKDIYLKAWDKGIEIKYNEDGQIELSHDFNWTAEAVFNLLDNAVKYGSKGNIIYLSVKRYGMFAEISVEDENGAIPYDERNNIFIRFYRGKNAASRQEGLGIGLYLSREIVVRQGGYINLRTTDKGNVFSVMMYIDIEKYQKPGKN